MVQALFHLHESYLSSNESVHPTEQGLISCHKDLMNQLEKHQTTPTSKRKTPKKKTPRRRLFTQNNSRKQSM